MKVVRFFEDDGGEDSEKNDGETRGVFVLVSIDPKLCPETKWNIGTLTIIECVLEEYVVYAGINLDLDLEPIRRFSVCIDRSLVADDPSTETTVAVSFYSFHLNRDSFVETDRLLGTKFDSRSDVAEVVRERGNAFWRQSFNPSPIRVFSIFLALRDNHLTKFRRALFFSFSVFFSWDS